MKKLSYLLSCMALAVSVAFVGCKEPEPAPIVVPPEGGEPLEIPQVVEPGAGKVTLVVHVPDGTCNGIVAVGQNGTEELTWDPSGTDFKAMADSAKAGLKAGPWVLIVTYFFLTVAELFISPLGLSFVSKVAPKHIQGLCQGLWLGATAIGNLFLWVGPLMYNKMPIWQCWTVFFVICLVSMGVMLGMVKWLERVTK